MMYNSKAFLLKRSKEIIKKKKKKQAEKQLKKMKKKPYLILRTDPALVISNQGYVSDTIYFCFETFIWPGCNEVHCW